MWYLAFYWEKYTFLKAWPPNCEWIILYLKQIWYIFTCSLSIFPNKNINLLKTEIFICFLVVSLLCPICAVGTLCLLTEWWGNHRIQRPHLKSPFIFRGFWWQFCSTLMLLRRHIFGGLSLSSFISTAVSTQPLISCSANFYTYFHSYPFTFHNSQWESLITIF